MNEKRFNEVTQLFYHHLQDQTYQKIQGTQDALPLIISVVKGQSSFDFKQYAVLQLLYYSYPLYYWYLNFNQSATIERST